MPTQSMSDPSYRRDLGDGLVLRWSTAADAEGLGRLYGHVFRQNAEAPLNTHTPAYARDCLSGRHPLIGPGDFALVEDTRQGLIVSATDLLAQTWEYEGIAFGVGRPEIVATEPDYRNRGLVRAIFELIHARSTARGQIVQAITGIPFYYRQFGYEFALDLGGNRAVFFAAIPKLKEGEPEPYGLREATLDDLPQLMALYNHERARGPISTRVDADYWRWVLDGQSTASGEGWNIQMIVDAAGRALGYVLPKRLRWGSRLGVAGFALEPGRSYVAVLPSVLRALQAHAERAPASKPDAPPADRLIFGLEAAHPAYDALGSLGATYDPPYAWYVRVPDLPGFMRHIAPALERRLVDSAVAGHSGELKLTFYRGGLRMRFEEGRLIEAEDWRAQVWGPKAEGGFPPLVFLQLLFGRRSLADLRYAYPDVWAEDDASTALIEALFPARPSWVLPLE
ncbi:MAG: GNAT family N-acetyltransferase [Roseiflexaceae bacterium]